MTPTPSLPAAIRRQSVQEQTDLGEKTENGQLESSSTRDATVSDDDTYEVRVSLTVAIPYRGKYPTLNDALELVVEALRKAGLPEGSRLHGGIDLRTRTAKEIRADTRRAAAKRKREEPYHTAAYRSAQ